MGGGRDCGIDNPPSILNPRPVIPNLETYQQSPWALDLVAKCGRMTNIGQPRHMRRIQDAMKAGWATLWGRSQVQLDSMRIRQEWSDQLMQIDSMFEKMNALAARLAKRSARAVDAEPPVAAPDFTPPSERGGKLAIRARIRARQTGIGVVGPNSDGEN